MALLTILTLISALTSTSATIAEYEVDSQPLLPCELAREKAQSSGADYIPQCSEEGLYRKIQCSRNATTCWCVDSDGAEVAGSRVTDSPPLCLSFCQLRKQRILVSGYINSSSTSHLPRCKNSGEYEDIQCDRLLGECWCVDNEGMEIYGTRQFGEPDHCPKRCAVRDRRILHDVGEKVPPHCSKDGGFQPVQCKLVNTTDQMAVDLVTHFSRFPDAFRSFSSLRDSFPEVSGYCYCADRLGRELAGTGVELLLDEICDTVFSALSTPRMFTETTIYRILQRRFLGVQLITSGRFRCPSLCEIQRFTTSQMGDIYVPTCDGNGDFNPIQCQQGGQCWCTDSSGREIYGSRGLRGTPNCESYQECPIQRRQALATMFFGPTGHFSQQSLFATQEEETGSKISSRFCPSDIVERFANLDLQLDSNSLGLPASYLITDMIEGLFQSNKQIQLALKFTSSPARFQQNLFGGKYLKNLGSFNFSGTIGTKNKFSFSDFFQQIGLTGLYSGGNFKELAKLFSSSEDSYLSRGSNDSKPIFNLNQPILASFGRTVNLEENQKRISFFTSMLERQDFFSLLRDISSMPPNIAEDVSEALKIILASKDCKRGEESVYVPACKKDGRYEQIQCSQSECWCVDEQGREVPGSRTADKKPRCPSKCEMERESQILLRKSQPAGSDLFIPACDKNGEFVRQQCAGDIWFCVDLEGRTIPGTQTTSGETIQCPSYCHIAAGSAFLKASETLLTAAADLSEVYIPQCMPGGDWRAVQCDGPTEQAFEIYEKWTTLKPGISFLETLQILLEYKELTSQSFPSFVRKLYDQEHYSIFPALSQYASFSDIPEEFLAGNITSASDNLLLNPYVFWRLLSGGLAFYPGSYNDFSASVSHVSQRSCWCVDPEGRKLPGMEKVPNKIPECPGTCEMAKLKSLQFMEEARKVAAASKVSNFPLGYNFLLASGVWLSENELSYAEEHRAGIQLSESFLKEDTYGLRLAAYSTLKAFQKSGSRETGQLSSLPYSPQCDGRGDWSPLQHHPGTGHYWCVDNKGAYIDGSLASRSAGPPQCQTSCQRAAATARISSWLPTGSSALQALEPTGFPKCSETGQYLIAGVDILCDNLENKTCPEDGSRSREQCDPSAGVCYCRFPDGEEASGTRVSISGKSDSMCQAPVCPLPFGSQEIKDGSLFCSEVEESGEKWQKCRLICQKGYVNVFSDDSFMCSRSTQRWRAPLPHLQPCQRQESFQALQAQVGFQLLLPATKQCSEDYSGLLEAFRTFILDDLKARGLCHIQINRFGQSESVAVCDDSTILVKCLTSSRMGVNVTWTARIREIPETLLPSLQDVENALAEENLVGRLLSAIRSGGYSLSLDSKLFSADKSEFFPQDSSTLVRLACARGFQKLQNAGEEALGGCGICPAGSYFEDGACLPCPLGFYQEKAGSDRCVKCRLGTTTLYTGAYNESHCVTRCQADTRRSQCDEGGQFLPSQKDLTTGKYYCVDNNGEKISWTETDEKLQEDKCLLLRKFELLGDDKLSILNDNEGSSLSKPILTQKTSLWECIQDCSEDESCDYVTLSGSGSGLICEKYTGDGSNVVCSSNTQVQTALGNSAATTMEGLRCQYKVKQTAVDNITVYRKKGEEFPTTGHKDFKRTDFDNALSGVYTTLHFPGGGGAGLTDGYYMCRQSCGQDACCDGFILSQILLNKGTIICGLLRSPATLLCNQNDWRASSKLGGDGVCKGVRSNKQRKMFSFVLGGQEFTGSYSLLSESLGMVEYSSELSEETKAEIQERFLTFQSVFLSTGGDRTRCQGTVSRNTTDITESVRESFLLVDIADVVVDQDGTRIANAEYWISKQHHQPDEALSWCLSRCRDEESWCRLVELRDTEEEFFTCLIYPDTWKCNNPGDVFSSDCRIMLSSRPQSLYRRREAIGSKVKHFYTRVAYRKLSNVTVRNRIEVTGAGTSQGFFQCELHCDADPCCRGFGYQQRPGTQGLERICLLVSSLGIKSCAEDVRSAFSVTNCSSTNEGMDTAPFGWYQKPEYQGSPPAGLCPPVDVLKSTKPAGSRDDWLSLDSGSVIVDSSLSSYDSLEITRDSTDSFVTAQDYCLSVCAGVPSCLTTTINQQQASIRCTFYPDTQVCFYSLTGHRCHLLVTEAAAYIYTKKAPPRPVASVTLPGRTILGKAQSVQIGSDVKAVHQFLGVPYAEPPIGENRFGPPQAPSWTGTWNATSIRPSCLQPGDGKAQYSSVSEDCLYLNIFLPQNARPNSAVLLYFHNSPSDYSGSGQTAIDGSYQTALGDIIVVTAAYRVGVFGFLSIGKSVPNGNWGLLDQSAALRWVQENIAYFGGDPERISIGADRAGADIASMLLLLPENNGIRRAALMGGSAFSPMFVVSEKRAREQVRSMAEEVGCSAVDDEATLACLRRVDAITLNQAQTKLLAINGPFQTWGPVVDGVYLQDTPLRLLQRKTSHNIDLFIGSTEHDGLISRAKAIKRFEESEGRGDSKMAFYRALQNSLGGEEMNPLVQEAAVWFYSLQHSTDDYSSFSRALENATRDHFIACPAVKMADHWSENSRGHVFMYHVPETYSQSSVGLGLPEDVMFGFGLPFHSDHRNQFTEEEKELSLRVMQYLANFVRTGNPNFPHDSSRRRSSALPPWPEYRQQSGGRRYKRLTARLPNHTNLKSAECSFWNDYIPALKRSASVSSSSVSPTKSPERESAPGVQKTSPNKDKESYN